MADAGIDRTKVDGLRVMLQEDHGIHLEALNEFTVVRVR